MGRERGEGATRPARRGTRRHRQRRFARFLGFDDRPATGPRPRRPAPGVPQSHEHTCKDYGALPTGSAS